MKDLGLQRDGQEGIDYRERAPLVVPPSRDLPPPRSEGEVADKTAAWPKDPDVRRRKEATAAEKARLKGNFSVEEDMRALRPDELDKPGRPAKGSNEKGTVEEAQRPMMPSDLGTKTKKLWGSVFSTWSRAAEEAPPPASPARGNDCAAHRLSDFAELPGRVGIRDKAQATTLEDRLLSAVNSNLLIKLLVRHARPSAGHPSLFPDVSDVDG
jgi:hypothetical protein